MFSGIDVNSGGAVSATMTLNVAILELPLSSVAVYSTCVVPTGNKVPGDRLDDTVEAPQRSVAVGSTHDTVAEQSPTAGL